MFLKLAEGLFFEDSFLCGDEWEKPDEFFVQSVPEIR